MKPISTSDPITLSTKRTAFREKLTQLALPATYRDSFTMLASKSKNIVTAFAFLFLLFIPAIGFSVDVIVTTNSNWSGLTGGSGPGGLPNSSDVVRVRNGAILTVDVVDGQCATLAIGQGGLNNFNSSVLFNNGSKVTVAGSVILGGIANRQGSIDMTAGGLLQIGTSVTVTNLGTFTAGTGTIEYNSAALQSVSAALVPAYNNLILTGSARKNATGNINVNGALTVNNGRFVIGAFILTIGDAGSITVVAPSSTNMIVLTGGEVRKVFTADDAFTFPIGENTGSFNYSPVSLAVRGTAYSNAYVSVSVSDAVHPNNASANHFLSRYWVVNQTGITDCNVDLTARYVDADINGTEGSIASAQLSGTFNQATNPWIKFGVVDAANNVLDALNATVTAGDASAFTGITLADPTVSIGGGNVSVCANVPVPLTTTVTGDPVITYLWSPAAGLSSSTDPNPTATVATTTVYTVTITDGNGMTATANTTITIIPGTPPNQPGGITGPIIICDGQTGVQFSVPPVAGATSYVWTLPAGATIATGAGTRIITVDFPATFTGGQICVATTNACNVQSAQRCLTLYNVTAYTPPSIVGPASVCANQTGLIYTIQHVDGAISYDWTVPTGMTITAGQGTQNITVDTDPSFTGGQICLTVSNGCGTSLPRCKNISSVGGSTPGGITGLASVCANTNGLAYSINAIAGAISYTWTAPTGFTIASGQGTTNITVDVGPNPIAGDICVVANYSCATSQPRCKTISINGSSVGFISGPASVCEGSTGVAYSVVAVPGATAYNWILPAGMTQASGGTTNSITVDVGVGFVTSDICVTVTTSCGTGLPECRTIVSTSANQPGPITGPIVVCPGTNGVNYSIAPVSGAVSYTWTAPTGMTIVTGTQIPNVVMNIDSSFTSGDICVVTFSACGSQSLPTCITVQDILNYTPPTINGSTTVCLNSTGWEYSINEISGADSYTWTLPAGMTFSPGSTIDSNVVFVDVDSTYVTADICVAVVASCGSSLNSCLNVSGSPAPPNTPGGITGDEVVCENTTGHVYSIYPVAGAVSYTWTAPAGMTITSGGSDTTVTVDIGPVYTTGDICVTATSLCGLVSLPRCLTVDENTGSTPPNISGPGTFCLNDTLLEYSIPAVNGANSYNWSLPNGMTFSAGTLIDSNAVFVDIGPGFTIGDICVATVNNCGTSLNRCKPVKEISLFTPGGITGPEIVCQNSTGIVYSLQPVSGAVSYEWIVPPGITITAGLNTRIITVDIDNTFTIGDIGVRAVASCGDKSLIRWNSTTTSVNPDLPGTISASGNICPGTTITFSITPVEDASSYEWVLPSGMTFTAGPPTNTSSVSVDIGAGFVQGEVCVKAVSACNVAGYMKCQTYNIIPATPGVISGPLGVCPSATGVIYTVNPVANAASYNWTLPPGWVITAGTGTNSITVDAAAGFFQGQISVNAVSSCGLNSGKRYLNISTNPGTPDDISGPTALCTGNTAVFTILPVDGADSYEWTLPAGLTVVIGSPSDENSISLDVNGGFTGGNICVVAKTNCGGISAQSCLALGTIPDAPAAIEGEVTLCAGTTNISYSVVPVAGISSYTWTVPTNMIIQSGQGTDEISVDVTGGFSGGQLCVVANTDCNSSSSTCINIGLTPNAPADIITPVNFCPGTVRTLTVDRVSGATNYNWTLPAGLTEIYGQGSPSITVLIATGFVSGQVCVDAETPCGAISTQYCETISVNPAGAPATIIASSVVCAGSDVSFSVPEVVGAGTFTWVVPAGMTIVSGQGSPSIVVSVAGGFTSDQVCVTASSGCGSSSSQTCRTFSNTPAMPGTVSSPPVVCAPSTGNIISVPVLAGISTYNWTVPAGITITSGQGSNAITFDVSGGFVSGQASVTAESACGTVSAPKTFNINTLLVTPGAIIAPASTCNNTTGLVFSVPLLTGATSYLWSVPVDVTITSGQGTNAITVDIGASLTSGQLCVQGISACGTAGASRCRTVRTLPNQPGGISGTFSNVCNQTFTYSCPNASGATSYSWTAPPNSNIVAGQGTRFVDVEFLGTFTSGQLEVVAVNSCGNSAPRLSPIITCGPAQPGPKVMAPAVPAWQINVYPVPATTEFITEFTADQNTVYLIELFDISGRLALSDQVAAVSGMNSFKTDVSSLPKGLYILKVSGNDGQSDYSKIVIE